MSWTLTKEILDEFVPEFGQSVFVETGTHLGGGVALALEAGFGQVFSCDINPQHHQRAVAQFAAAANVSLSNSDSVSFLAELVPRLDRRFTVFWLDAHGNGSTPVLDELAIIARFEGPKLVLIDDMRFFRQGIKWARHLPISQLEQAVATLGSPICFRDSKLYAEDILCTLVAAAERPPDMGTGALA